jgi:hypothetical protein
MKDREKVRGFLVLLLVSPAPAADGASTVDAMVCTSPQRIHYLAALPGTKVKSETHSGHSSVHLWAIGCDLGDLGDLGDPGDP